MHVIKVKKTYLYDFDKIYPLLTKFDSPYSREDWMRIFSYDWDGAEDYVGFHLECDSRVVGFMGLIFSCRYRNDKRYAFCNITSLIVEDDYRAAAILLIRKLKSLDNTILTGLNPIDESYKILKMIGFSDYETRYIVIPTINHLRGLGKRKVDVYGVPALLDRVDSESRRIVVDHVDLNSNSVFFDFNGNCCLLVYKILNQRHFGILIKKIRILYISDMVSFNDGIVEVLQYFNKLFGLFSAIYLDARFLRDRNLFLSFVRNINLPRICFNPVDLQMDVDELYSETVLLS